MERKSFAQRERFLRLPYQLIMSDAEKMKNSDVLQW